MTTFQMPGSALEMDAQSSTTPLVVLFERDDAIAVPLLSQLRIAGYDVRGARTPVELFDVTSKQLVALILIDLGGATAGRREFWVALDGARRGRSIQVMTFRYTAPGSIFDTDFEPSARAMADVEVHGAHEFQAIIDGVRGRVASPALTVMADPFPQPFAQPSISLLSAGQPGYIPPIGAALGIPSPFMSLPAAAPQLGVPHMPKDSSPFAHPATSNPFIETGQLLGAIGHESEDSPFAQPYSTNPFAATVPPSESQSLPFSGAPSHAFSYQMAEDRPVESFEERAARLSEAYASQFGILGTQPYTSMASAGASTGVAGNPEAMGRAGAQPSSVAWDSPELFDSWTPPGAGELDWRSLSQTSNPTMVTRSHGMSAGDQEAAFTTTEYAPAVAMSTGIGSEFASRQSSFTPPARKATPTEEALGSVLVEGSLLSEQKLEALRGVQEMLSNVDIDFKLGELALLFKFLSPDQLLAALLVSRGLVTPQQIASLGRTKQDLANSSLEYTLADLLVMFDILPEEKVRQIKSEIAQ